MFAHVEMSNQQTVSAADQACASWVIHCSRRYCYLCWADTSWLTIHLPLGRTCYYYGDTDRLHQLGGRQAYLWGDITLGRRYVWLNDTHLLYLGWLVLLLTWAIHTLVGATFEGDTHLLTITWAIHNLVGATLHTLKLLLHGRYISCSQT